MAYRIDFTASNYANRSRRKILLRMLLVAAIAGVAWSLYNVYTVYNEPTLDMRLGEYNAASRQIEEMNAAWDEAANEYGRMLRYYRLVWAASPTNFLNAMVSKNAPKLGNAYTPTTWTLTTGGKCKLDYRFNLGSVDKAEQARKINPALVCAVTSVVDIVDGRVDVQGVQLENLLRITNLNVSAIFSLPDVKQFPEKEKMLANCANEIGAFRKKVQESVLFDSSEAKGVPTTAKAMMMEYLPIGKDTPGVPDFMKVIDVANWFKDADAFIAQNRISGDGTKRLRIKEMWNGIGAARYPWGRLPFLPWGRFRLLDNEELVERTKALSKVADGVKPFKGFLDQRQEDCKKKLEPLIEAYYHNDVFNKPLVESDLQERIAKEAGISGAKANFEDEKDVEPAVLEKADERFLFTWIRWKLSMGDLVGGRPDGAGSTESAASKNSLTLEKVADCARRAVELGPGYVIDKVTVRFDDKGKVSGAILEGLLPVKKVEPKKEAKSNVN